MSVGLTGFLQTALANREFHSADNSDESYVEVVAKLNERLAKLEAAVPAKAKRHAAQELALVLDDLGRGALFPERPAETIDLQGWLELAWEDAPHLIVAGANEGVLPETIHGDLLAGEHPCAALPAEQRDRFARDAWLLELLIRSRR